MRLLRSLAVGWLRGDGETSDGQGGRFNASTAILAAMSGPDHSDSAPKQATPAPADSFGDAVGPVTPLKHPQRRRFDRAKMSPQLALARRQAAAGAANEQRNVLTLRDGLPASAGYQLSAQRSEPAASGSLDGSNPEVQVGPEELLSWRRNGVQKRVLRRLRAGGYPISATLDLHGRTVAEAQEALLRFITAAAADRRRCLLIVHGKSAAAAAPARLKNCVNAWLRQHPQVNAFHSAKREHGGAGALYVLIGKRPP